MAMIFTNHPPATIECITAFSKWFGLSPLDSDIDIQTDVALATGELGGLIDDLIAVPGGEAPPNESEELK